MNLQESQTNFETVTKVLTKKSQDLIQKKRYSFFLSVSTKR
jgi:hypothetical protein